MQSCLAFLLLFLFFPNLHTSGLDAFCWGEEEGGGGEGRSRCILPLLFGVANVKENLLLLLLFSRLRFGCDKNQPCIFSSSFVGRGGKGFFPSTRKIPLHKPQRKEGLLCISGQRAESATCILRKVGDCCSLFFFLFFLFSSKSSFRLRSPFRRPHVDASSQMRPSSSGIHQKEHR